MRGVQAAQAVGKRCSGCGARVEFPAGAVSISCSYCSSPLVDDQRAESVIDKVAPFRVEQSVAQTKLGEFLSGKIWAPAQLRRLRFDPRRLRGVLVPFWVYAGVVRSEYASRIGIHWYRTETYTDSEGKTRTRQVQETEWFSLDGSAACRVADHLVSASTGLSEPEANALEPFDLGWARPFDPRLVSGFEAELPSVDRARANQVAVEELRDREAVRIQAEVLPGDVRRLSHVSSEVTVERCEIVLMPVWMSSFKHKGRVHRLLVNGQNGRVIGQVPKSPLKIAAAVVGALVLIAIPIVLWKLGVFG